MVCLLKPDVENKLTYQMVPRAGIEPASVESESTVLSIILPGHDVVKVLYYTHSL